MGTLSLVHGMRAIAQQNGPGTRRRRYRQVHLIHSRPPSRRGTRLSANRCRAMPRSEYVTTSCSGHRVRRTRRTPRRDQRIRFAITAVPRTHAMRSLFQRLTRLSRSLLRRDPGSATGTGFGRIHIHSGSLMYSGCPVTPSVPTGIANDFCCSVGAKASHTVTSITIERHHQESNDRRVTQRFQRSSTVPQISSRLKHGGFMLPRPLRACRTGLLGILGAALVGCCVSLRRRPTLSRSSRPRASRTPTPIYRPATRSAPRS